MILFGMPYSSYGVEDDSGNPYSKSNQRAELYEESESVEENNSEDDSKEKDQISLEDALRKYFDDESATEHAKSYYELGKKIGSQWIYNYEKELLQSSFCVENEFKKCYQRIESYLLYVPQERLRDLEDGILDGLASQIDKVTIEDIETRVLKDLDSKRETTKMGVEGGSISSSDKVFTLKIPIGCFYEDVNVIIDEDYNSFYSDHNYGKTLTKPYNILIDHNLPLSDSNVEIIFSVNNGDNKAVARMVNDGLSILAGVYEDNKLIVTEHLSTLNLDPSYFLIETDAKANLKDIDNSLFKKEISFLSRANIITGYEDFTFRPDLKISRLEFLTLIGKTMNWPENYHFPNVFNDHNTIHYSHSYVGYAYDHGIIKGDENKNFAPNDFITYRHGISMLNRLGIEPINPKYVLDHWSNYKLHRSDLLESEDNHLKREEMAFFIYHLNNNSLNEI